MTSIYHSSWSYMEKISLKLVFILLFASTYSERTYAMEQARAHVVPQPHALMPLKNGALAPAQIVFDTHLAVIRAITNNAAFALRQLVQTCRDNTQELSPEACRVLRPYGLINEEDRPNPALINIIISMAKDNGEKMSIVNPINYAALDPQ